MISGRPEYTPKTIEAFFTHLAELCNVSRAADACGLHRRTIYLWREKYPDFKQRMDDVLEVAVDDLEQEARRRAYAGVDELVFYKGEVCGTIRKYSDTLLIFLLKANRAKFRDRLTVDVNAIDDEIERRLAIMGAGSEAAISSEVTLDSVN